MLTQPFAIPAALIFLFAIPLVMKIIPPNRFYGFRTLKTQTDDHAWYLVNRFAGVALMLASLAYAVTAIAWPYNKSANGDFTVWLIHLAVFLLPLISAIVLTQVYARRL